MKVGIIELSLGLAIYLLAPYNPVAVAAAAIGIIVGLYDIMKGKLQ